MKILTKAGKALVAGNGVLALKPYKDAWGYTIAKKNETTPIYDLLYYNFAIPFVEGSSRDGGRNVGVGRDQYLHYLEIPLSSLALDDTSANRKTVWDMIYYVCKDNPHLNVSNFIGDTDLDYTDEDFSVENGLLKTVAVTCMLDVKRRPAVQQMDSVVAQIVAEVYSETGKSPGDALTKAEEITIAKLLHDWIVDNSSYATHRSFYEQYAYVVFWNDGDNHEPVCAAFSAAYAYLCCLYNINCVYIQGASDVGYDGTPYNPPINHAWNIIAFGTPIGEFPTDPAAWTPVDTTFDVHLKDAGSSDTDKFFGSSDIYFYDGSATPTRANTSEFQYPVNIPTGLLPVSAT